MMAVGTSPWGDIAEIFSLLHVTLSSWKALRRWTVNAGLNNTQRKLGCTNVHLQTHTHTHSPHRHIFKIQLTTRVCATGVAASLKDVAGLCTFLCVILRLMATLMLQGAGTERMDPPVAPRHPSSTSASVTNAS